MSGESQTKLGWKEATLLVLVVALAAVVYGALYFSDYRYLSERHALARRCVPASAPEPLRRAMRKVPRHRFVGTADIDTAYEDRPLRAPEGRAITQPSLTADMMAQLDLSPEDNVLAIDASSGYEVALLAEQCAFVAAVAFSEAERESCAARLKELDYDNVAVEHAEGHAGLEEHAPYDAIFARCAVPEVPEAWTEQLSTGGKIIVSIGTPFTLQMLTLFVKQEDGALKSYPLQAAVFMPMEEVSPPPEWLKGRED